MDFYSLMMIIKIHGKNDNKRIIDMKKAVLGSVGYCKECCICGKYIENEMYEEIQSRRSVRVRYFHVKCANRLKTKNRKDVL